MFHCNTMLSIKFPALFIAIIKEAGHGHIRTMARPVSNFVISLAKIFVESTNQIFQIVVEY